MRSPRELKMEGYEELQSVTPETTPPGTYRPAAKQKLDVLNFLLAQGHDDLMWILAMVAEKRDDVKLHITVQRDGHGSQCLVDVADHLKLRPSKLSVMSGTVESDPQPVLQFARAEIHTFPHEQVVTVQLVRTGTKIGRSEVTMVTADRNAKDGVHYTHVERSIVFEPGQGLLTVDIPIFNVDTWEAVVEFEVHLKEETVKGATLARQLKTSKVKIVGTQVFPSNDLEADYQKWIIENNDEGRRKIRFYLAFLRLLWSTPVVRSGMIQRMLAGQLHNVNFVLMQFISVFTINFIFKTDKYTDKHDHESTFLVDCIDMMDRHNWIIAIVCFQILSLVILHIVDYRKLSWRVGGPGRKLIQKGILRRFMYFDIQSRTEVRNAELALGVTRNTSALVGGASLCVHLSQVIGGLVSIIMFKVTAPFVFQGKAHARLSPIGFVPFFIYPVALSCYIYLRSHKTTDVLDKVQDAENRMLEYLYQAVDCFPVLNDYHRRQRYVDDLDPIIEHFNQINKRKNEVLTNNSYFPIWCSAIFIAFWYLIFGQQVIEASLSLGFFLADLKVIEKFGEQFELLYSILMSMEATFPDLERVVWLLNKGIDADERLEVERSNLKLTEEMRAEYSKQGQGALDRLPLYSENLEFTVKQDCVDRPFRYPGRIEVQQGQMVCFVGKHGRGKSLLLKVMSGSVFPKDLKGELFIPSHLRVLHVSLESLFLRMSLFDNLVFGVMIEEDRARARVVKILQQMSLHEFVPLLDDDHQRHSRNRSKTLTDIDDAEHTWMSFLTVQEASMLNMARAIIANPHVLFVHKPAAGKAKIAGQAVMSTLREFVQNRGVEQNDSQPVSARRPRTILYTSIHGSSSHHADIVYKVSHGSVSKIALENLRDEMYG